MEEVHSTLLKMFEDMFTIEYNARYRKRNPRDRSVRIHSHVYVDFSVSVGQTTFVELILKT